MHSLCPLAVRLPPVGSLNAISKDMVDALAGQRRFSIAAVDGRSVSWRFKSLDQGGPFVLITLPVDRRLVTNLNHTSFGTPVLRAKAVGDAPIEIVEVRVDEGDWASMAPVPGAAAIWQASAARGERVVLRAQDAQGRVDEGKVDLAGPGYPPLADGSDADRIGGLARKGHSHTQLGPGPNRNGRKW
jgi:hypothetical protein